MITLEKCNLDNLHERQAFWINFYQKIGCDLTNSTTKGYKHSDETKAQMSRAKKGTKQTEEHINKRIEIRRINKETKLKLQQETIDNWYEIWVTSANKKCQ